MRKSLVLLLLLLLFCAPPGPAVAGPFATEVTQLLNHVELVLSYAAQANQLATQIKILADAIKNTVNNPHQLFWNIQADLNAACACRATRTRCARPGYKASNSTVRSL